MVESGEDVDHTEVEASQLNGRERRRVVSDAILTIVLTNELALAIVFAWISAIGPPGHEATDYRPLGIAMATGFLIFPLLTVIVVLALIPPVRGRRAHGWVLAAQFPTGAVLGVAATAAGGAVGALAPLVTVWAAQVAIIVASAGDEPIRPREPADWAMYRRRTVWGWRIAGVGLPTILALEFVLLRGLEGF